VRNLFGKCAIRSERGGAEARSRHQSLIRPQGGADVAEQGAIEERKRRRETKLVDVAHEVMRKDQARLSGLVRAGMGNVQREQFKGKVKKKVWDVISEELGVVDPDMVEEVTERIVDVAEVDPAYKRMFEEDEA
jgi:hypothetical protein